MTNFIIKSFSLILALYLLPFSNDTICNFSPLNVGNTWVYSYDSSYSYSGSWYTTCYRSHKTSLILIKIDSMWSKGDTNLYRSIQIDTVIQNIDVSGPCYSNDSTADSIVNKPRYCNITSKTYIDQNNQHDGLIFGHNCYDTIIEKRNWGTCASFQQSDSDRILFIIDEGSVHNYKFLQDVGLLEYNISTSITRTGWGQRYKLIMFNGSIYDSTKYSDYYDIINTITNLAQNVAVINKHNLFKGRTSKSLKVNITDLLGRTYSSQPVRCTNITITNRQKHVNIH